MEIYCTKQKYAGSRGQMLKHVHALKLEINVFMDMKGKYFLQCTDHDWICDFAFHVDTTQYLNELISSLERTNHLINKLFAK
jgi:hypothetical protein